MKSQLDSEYKKVLEIAKNNGAASDDNAEALAALVRGEETKNANVTKAFDIFKHTYKKETIESMLLADISAKEIQSLTRIPEEVVEIYCRFFFNTQNFEDELDKLEYVENYSGCDYGKKIKRMAIERGKESLKVKLSRGAYHVSADTALNSVRAMAYMLSQAAMTNPMDSDISREAFKWAQLCARTAVDKKESTADNVENLIIDLQTHDETTNVEKSGIDPDEILK